jgi:hypothetical protein
VLQPRPADDWIGGWATQEERSEGAPPPHSHGSCVVEGQLGALEKSPEDGLIAAMRKGIRHAYVRRMA